MKIAVAPVNYRATSGGSHTFERTLLSEIAAMRDLPGGHSLVVVSSLPQPAWWQPGPVDWLHMPTTFLHRVVAAPYAFSQYARGRSARQAQRDAHARHISRFMERHHIDIVWQMSPGNPPLDLPYVATLWDLQHRLQPWFPETSTGNEWWDRETYYSEWLGRSLRIIVPNAVARDEVERAYGVHRSRLMLVGHPVDPFLDIGGPRAQEPSARDSHCLFYPAQFWPHKNHVCLLRALHWLHREHDPRWHLVLTGSDKGNAAFIRGEAERLGLTQAIDFRGFVTRESLVHLYRTCFAVVFPSFFGPENLPPLEGMSFGCPVVAAQVDGATEQFGSAAALFDPLNAEALGHSVATLKNDPRERERLVHAGYGIAAANTPGRFVRLVVDAIAACEGYRRTWPGSSCHPL
jgi:glycosyltransferase involved in cell wall biosynthesis